MKMTNIKKSAALGLLALGLAPLYFAGCVAPRHAHVVVIEAGHVHTARCGHYRHGKRWYYVKGHKHGPRCGHHFVGGFWIVK